MDARATRRARPTRCRGTVEDHQKVALDVRELIRQGVFTHTTGSTFQLNLRYPWMRALWLDWNSLTLHLATGRAIVVPFRWTECGAIGARLRLLCPRCSRRVCLLYHLDDRLICRPCGRLWYRAQRMSSGGRQMLAIEKLCRKLGDHGQVPDGRVPPSRPACGVRLMPATSRCLRRAGQIRIPAVRAVTRYVFEILR